MVRPTVEIAKRVSKQRIAPMIDSTPALQGRVAEPATEPKIRRPMVEQSV